MQDSGYSTLLQEAVEASEDVTELRDEEGRLARIERHESYPGAVCVRLDATEAQTPYPTLWVLPAMESRPSFYPAEIPFLGGLSCRARQAPDRLFVIWYDENRTDPAPELKQQVRASMPGPLREVLGDLKEAYAAGESVSEESVQEIIEEFGSEPVREWTAGLLETSAPDERLVAAFDTIVRECLKSGWYEDTVEAEENALPMHRTTTLRNSKLQRALVLGGMFGRGSLLLTQEPLEALDPASDQVEAQQASKSHNARSL